jgi:hypothetical protein
MHAGADVVFAEKPFDEFLITDFSFDENCARRDRLTVSVHEIIKHDDLFTLIDEVFDGCATDVSGAAGN